jgi:aminoglycoside phosphotransferase (APT) family kinase protein
MSDDHLRARLERFIASRLEGADVVRVTRLERSTEGFSQETFVLDVDVGRNGRTERRGWVVKREPVAGLLEPYDLEPEFRVLHALSDDPLPSPPTPWFERDPAVLERPFYVMERLPGDVPIPAARADGTGPFDDAERAALGPEVADALARLHGIPWRGRFDFLGAPAPGRAAGTRELARWEDRIRRSGLPVHPALAEALSWLRRSVPPTDEITLVHGDYRLGNFLVVREGGRPRLAGILDWEMVHLGDPLEDVAWCASPLWRAGTPWASALLAPEEFAARWAATSGRRLDAARLRFWDVLAIVKMCAIMLTGIQAFRDGRTADLRMAIFDHQLPFLYALLGMARGWMAAA